MSKGSSKTGRRLRRTSVALTGAVLMLAAACGDVTKSHPQNTFRPKGREARTIFHLINPVFAIGGIVFVLILGGCLFITLKFRVRDGDDADEFPAQVHGNMKVEIGWTIVPAVILLGVGVATVTTIFNLARAPKADAVRVEVYGQQWWWEYRYDTDGDGKYDDIITANDLVVPAGRQVSLRIRARDVNHSWWAPALNGKRDAVPGRTHPLTIEADKPGEYLGQCTEFCGLSHANMRVKVVALTAGGYTDWVANQRKPAANPTSELAQAGWQVFTGQCTSCHRIRGLNDPTKVAKGQDPAGSTTPFVYPKVVNQRSGAAPNLTHLMSRSTFAGGLFDLRKGTLECKALAENWARTAKDQEKCLNRVQLEDWLRDPPGVKPMAPGATMGPASRGMPNLNLTEQQIDQLVAYLQTLK